MHQPNPNRCMRSFHATVDAGANSDCKALGFSKARAMQSFLCFNCQYKQHQCFACGELGSSDKTSGAEVFSCVSATCGYFYHPECVAKLLSIGNDAEGEELRKRIAAGESFTCPIHICHICKGRENKEVNDLQFAVCRCCPRACHRKCLPRKISFEDIEEEDVITRAWEGLLPNNRVLIYCSKHEIDETLATPLRNHIIFPRLEEKRKFFLDISSNSGNVVAKKRLVVTEDFPSERIISATPKHFKKVFSNGNKAGPSRKRERPISRQELLYSSKLKPEDASRKSLKDSIQTVSVRVSSADVESGAYLGKETLGLKKGSKTTTQAKV
ncbi:hypothetical protein IFM89_020739 [Coptis chinensis]|uniref:Zinc finger PHD-type domain-containing protein n=1 Tax=Coptis chinensis TaxID=261450 RepID=A0A835M8Q7_9MAGN|nr:hypothetical protein IFM89_020739 [Coptis chinensis]